MKAIAFNMNGKMAHFRKYYSNSTALSYMIPPITTIKGIIAGLLGYERDSYYEIFSKERCKTGIVVRSPIKKMSQTMNLLKVESLRDLSGAGLNRTQNDTEFIIPRDIRNGIVSYRIFFHHEEEQLMEELQSLLCTDQCCYQSKGIHLSMGSMQCQGWISEAVSCMLTQRKADSDEIPLVGIIPKETVVQIDPIKNPGLDLLKEETLVEFGPGRTLTENSKREVLVNMRDIPLLMKLKEETIYYEAEGRNIMIF